MLSANTVLQNRYRIIRLLGQGGMGAVYLAVDERLGYEVALKQMFHAQQQVMAQAFEREAKILARLHHRCLPKVSDHFSEEDSRYLVMQYIVGKDLAELLDKYQRPLSIEQVLIWADNLLDALEYLHSHEPPILHRDIKPQNIKINEQGELFLLDFGLAKDTPTSFSKSHLPSVIGFSFNYSPLEQINRERTTAETDIYAFCATFYHLLTNNLPADSFSRLTAKADGLPDTLIPANQLNPQVSAELASILQRGMNLHREQRLNATQLRQLLKNLKSGSLTELPTIPIDSDKKTAQATTPLPFSAAALNNEIVAPAQQPSLLVTNIPPQTTNPNSVSTLPKSKRNFLLTGVAAIIFLFVSIVVGIIGYVQLFPSAQPTPTPIYTPTVEITPTATSTIDKSTPIPANTNNPNIKKSENTPAPKTPTPAPKTPTPKSENTKTVTPTKPPSTKPPPTKPPPTIIP